MTSGMGKDGFGLDRNGQSSADIWQTGDK